MDLREADIDAIEKGEDLADEKDPALFNGYRTRHMDGASFAAMLGDASAPQRRDRQYYELQGNRGYISGTWKIVSLQAPKQQADLNNWMLFDLANDPAELHDLAAAHPDVLKRLIAEFEVDASANYVYPLDTRDELRALTLPPHELEDAFRPREFYRAGQTISGVIVSPLIADRDFTLSAKFDYAAGDEGVIFAMGDRFAGMVAYVMDGALYFVYQLWYRPIELAPIMLEPGAQEFVLQYHALGERRGRGEFQLNGMPVRESVDLSPTLVRVGSGGMDVGINRRQAVSERYAQRGTFSYSGKIGAIRLEPGPHAHDTPIVVDEAAVQARMRAARTDR